VPGALMVAVAAPVLLLAAFPAQAASCAQVAINPGAAPTLSPSSVRITAGGCVSYTDRTAFTVRVTVGKVSGSADPNTAVTFREPVPGTFHVSAQQQLSGQPLGGAGTGTLTVTSPPRPAPSPTRSSPRPSPRASSPAPTASASTSPSAAATPRPTTSVSPPPLPTTSAVPTPIGNPPIVVGIPPQEPTPSSSAAAVYGGRLQPPSGRGVGLPAAIAALLLVGAAAAFGRVLLAEPVAHVRPVDSRH
jgi:hypothetical protein